MSSPFGPKPPVAPKRRLSDLLELERPEREWAPAVRADEPVEYRRISDLPAANQALDTDQFEINQLGVSRSVSLNILKGALDTRSTYDTAADVSNAVVPPMVWRIRTNGYLAPNDGGAADYARVASMPADHDLVIVDKAGAIFEMASDPVPLKATGAKGNGLRDPNTGSYSGDSDVFNVKRWVDCALALSFAGYANPGCYLIDQGDVCAWDTVKGLTLYGETGRTTFVHQIGHPAGEIGFSFMMAFGRLRVDNHTGGGAGVPSFVNWVGPNQSGIVTTQTLFKGQTVVVPLNTLAIGPLTAAGTPRNLQPEDYIGILDPSQVVPYRGGKITAITNITNSMPARITAPGHGIDPDDIDGELTPVTGVGGMVEINNTSWVMRVSDDDPDTLIAINCDSTLWGKYTGGGQLGNGGLSGPLGEYNRIVATDPTAVPPTITLQTTPDFTYNAGARIGVFHNPCEDIVWEGIDIAYDRVKSYHEGVVAAVRIQNGVRIRVSKCNAADITSRLFTFENSLLGTLDRVIASFEPGVAANISGIGQGSCWWTVSNCLMSRGGHCVQIGGAFDGIASAYILMTGCMGVGCGSLGDTHWHARNITFRGNKVGSQQDAYEGNTHRGSCFTIRGWYSNVIADNECYGHAEGIKWWQGGEMGGSVCYGNLLHACKTGITAMNYNKLIVEANRFIDCSSIGLDIYATSGPPQGHSILTGMRIKRNTFNGASSLAAVRAQFQSQPMPPKPEDWLFGANEISGNPANEYLGVGDMAGQLQYFMSGRSSDPAFAQHAPWYPMSTTTGALSATTDVSGVTAKYRPGEIVTGAGGTSTSMVTFRVGDVTLLGLSLSQAGRGFKVGDQFLLQGGISNPNTSHVGINVTGIDLTRAVTVDGVAYGPLTTYTFTPGIIFSSLPAGDVFAGAAVFRTVPPGVTRVGEWRSVRQYHVNEGVTYSDGVPYYALVDNINMPPPEHPEVWKAWAPTGFQARFVATATAPTGPVTINDAGAYSAPPPNPVQQLSTTGQGSGLQFNVTWASNSMLDAARSPRELVLASGATIASLGPGKNLKRVIRLATDTTWQAGPSLVPPSNLTQFVRAGWCGEWYADENSVWRCTSHEPATAEAHFVQQTNFPPVLGVGWVREWADNTGRILRQRPDGVNIGRRSPNSRVFRATPLSSGGPLAWTQAGNPMIAVAGSASGVGLSADSQYTRTPRALITSGTTNAADTAWELALFAYLNESHRVTITWGWDVAQPLSTCFVGLKLSGPLTASANPATNIPNCIGYAHNSNNTAKFVHGDAATPAAQVDLGVNFPTLQLAEINQTQFWFAPGCPQGWWQHTRTSQAGVSYAASGVFTSEIPQLGLGYSIGLWSNTRSLGNVNTMALFDITLETEAV